MRNPKQIINANMANNLPLNVKGFGAKGDGVTDDTDAIQAALDEAILTKRGIYIPSGDYLLNSLVSATFAGYIPISIRGDGKVVSRLVVNNTDGAISLVSTQRTSPVAIADFSIVSKVIDGGTAFSYTVPEGGVEQMRVFEAHNINIAAYDYNVGETAFSSGLIAEGMYRPYISNVMIGRSFASTLKGIDSVGISVNGTFKPHITDCYVNIFCNIGISDVGVNGEGLYIKDTTVNGADIGILHRRDAREPEFWIMNCHVNALVVGVHIDGAKYAWIKNNLMYCLPESNIDYVDFFINNADGLDIGSNIFRQGYATDRVHYKISTAGSLNSDGTASGDLNGEGEATPAPIVKNIKISDFEYSVTSGKSIVEADANVVNIEVHQPTTLSAENSYTDIYDVASGAEDEVKVYTPSATSQLWYGDSYASDQISRVISMMVAGDTVVISCIGDSITWGSDSNNTGTQVSVPYPDRLQEILRDYYDNANITVINQGVSGNDSGDVLARIDTIKSDEPDLLLLLVGTNDVRSDRGITANEYRHNLESIRRATVNIAMAMVSITNGLRSTDLVNSRDIQPYREEARLFAELNSVKFIDFSETMQDLIESRAYARGDIQQDRLHFSEFGYSLIAETIFAKGLTSSNIFAEDKTYIDAFRNDIRGDTSVVSLGTEDNVEVLIANSGVVKIYVYVTEPNLNFIGHFKLSSYTSGSSTRGLSVINSSLSNASQHIKLDFLATSSTSNTGSVPINLVYLRGGLNVIEFSCSATETARFASLSVIKNGDLSYLTTGDKTSGKNKLQSQYPTILTKGLRTVTNKTLQATDPDIAVYNILKPLPMEDTQVFRFRMHCGSNTTMSLGVGSSSVIGEYINVVQLSFRAIGFYVYVQNLSDAQIKVYEDLTLLHATPGVSRLVELKTSASGTAIYIDGTLKHTLDFPLPIGHLTLGSSGTTGDCIIIDSIRLLGSSETLGSNIIGEEWFDYATDTYNIVKRDGTVISSTYS